MSNCQVEEDVGRQENTIQTVSLDEAISFVKQNPLNSSSKTGKKKTFTPDFDAITQEKITNSDQLITVIPLYSNTRQEYSRILLLKIKDTIKSVVFSMFPDKDALSKDFCGKILITKINGEFVNGFRIKKGYIVSQFVKKKTSTSNSRMQSKIIIIDGVEFEELNEVIVMNNYHSEPSTISYMTLFNDWSGSSGSEINYGTSWEYSSDGGGGGSNTTSTEQAIEDKIDDSELDPCTKGVLDKLKNTTEKDISKMINRFNPDGSIFNIKMATGKVTDQNDKAQTTKVNGSATDVNIVFSEDYIKGTLFGSPPTDLSVATTMAHEVIHAYLISLLAEHNACASDGICDFPTIFDAYVQHQSTKNTTILPDAHHELIAKDYVYAIASTVEQFHLGDTFVTDYPRQVYIDMAWGGLIGTYIFNKNYPDDPADKNFNDRERILDRINTEFKGTPYQGYTPVGTPCKN